MKKIISTFPLHPAQENVYLDQLAHPNSPIYNIGAYMLIEEVCLSRINQAWKSIVSRYDALRLEIVPQKEGLPLQRVLPADKVTTVVEYIDYSQENSPEEIAHNWMQSQYEKIFDISKSQRYQIALLKLTKNRYYIFFRFHHFFCDGISAVEIVKRVYDFYQNPLACHSSEPPSYRPVADSAHSYLHSTRYAKDAAFWKTFLQQHTITRLPRYYQQKKSGIHSVPLTATLSSTVRKFCQTCKISPLTLMLSAVTLYFTQTMDLNELVVSTAVHGRKRKGGMQTIGMHSDTTLVALHMNECHDFNELLLLVNKQLKQSLRYHQFPQSHVSRLLGISHSNLSDIYVNYQVYAQDNKVIQSTHPFINHLSGEANEPLHFNLIDFQDTDQLILRLNYQDAYFQPEEMSYLSKRFVRLLERCICEPSNPLSKISLLDSQERDLLLHTWNATDVPYPKDNTLYQLFEEQVDKTPDNIALVFENQQLAYRQLNLRANQLARQIRATYQQRHGRTLSPDTLIALYLDRSLEMIISILAVLKAGGAYVPIAPEYPQSRTLFILEDTKAPLLLTQSHYTDQLDGWINKLEGKPPVLIATDQMSDMENYVIENLLPVSKAQDLAYVIYTSGTTGNPKGVMLSQNAFANFISGQKKYYQNNKEKLSILGCSQYVFDIFGLEFALPLICGGLTVLSNTERFQNDLQNHKKNIDIIQQTPSMWQVLLSDSNEFLDCSHIQILVGGESGSTELYESLSGIFNTVSQVYGPTESCIWSSNAMYSKGKESHIGKPLPNEKVYILSKEKEPVAIGVPGELYIGGAGLARGYLNQPELTAERFIDNPFATEADIANGYTRLYKTGDLVRWLPDGNLEYLGRNDFQVKIRGYRIELGEIENALTALPQVSQAVVIDREQEGTKYLAAYCIAADTRALKDKARITTLTDSLRQQLQASLPEYMVPATFTVIEDIPLTINGKLDRRALPAPEFINTDSYVAPQTETETQLCAVWAEVMGLERVGIHDNFFRIGGNSISAIRLTAKSRQMLDKDIALALLFDNPTVARLANKLSTTKVIIPVSKHQNHLPLSFAQERLLFIEQYEQGTASYHIPHMVTLDETADDTLLLRAINQLAVRHRVLNSTYHQDNETGMYYTKECQSPLSYQCGFLDSHNELKLSVQTAIAQPFNLTEEPPLRLCLYRCKHERHLLLVWHHIAFDGWSMAVFMQELAEIYKSLRELRPSQLPALSISYGDYADWQRHYLQGEVLDKTLSHWKQQLAGYETLNLPADYPRPQHIDYQGANDNFNLTEKLSDQLRQLACDKETTLYTILLSGFYLLLNKLSNQSDLVLGTPSDNRHHPQTQALIGFFVNALPLRLQLDSNGTLNTLIEQVHATVADAKTHQELPFEKLVSELNIERDTSRHPVFQVMFSLQSFDTDSDSYTGLPFTTFTAEDKVEYSPAKFDLSLFVDDSDNCIQGQWNYAVGLFTEDTIRRFNAMYLRVLTALVENTTQHINQIDVLSRQERHTLLHTWNATDAPYPKDNTLYQLFEEQVDKTPDNIALVFEDQQLTYRQLNLRANQLARQIRATYQQRHGSALSPDTLIALYLDRSPEMIISILAVLKAGGAYVPVAPEYPQSRTLFILEDTKAPLLLTQSHYTDQLDGWINKLKGKPPVLIATDQMSDMANYATENLLPVSKAKDLAYVIYTSGTTGNPKGVMIEHCSVVNYFTMFLVQTSDHYKRVDFSSNYCFDLSVTATLCPLLAGSTICIYGGDILDSLSYQKHLSVNNVSLIKTTPSIAWQVLPGMSHQLGMIILGGEALGCHDVLDLCHYTNKVVDEYGPTEATVGSYFSQVYPAINKGLGKPYGNVKAYILSTQLQALSVGTPGELYLGGAGLARGYLNRPELTAERFINNPFATEADIANGYTRLYKTGDLVRWLPDGNLEYLGRNDFQVKIRGYRIELGEIEKALTALPQVSQAVVIDREREGTKYLAAYCIAADTRASKDNSRITTLADALRQQLQASLPEYMVPATFTVIEDIPLTINGKLDRRALPAPEFINTDSYVAPRTETETQLCTVWAEVLGLERVGIHDNFFRIGGDSILCIQITSRLRQKDLVLQVKDIFEAPTVALLAQRLVDTTATVAVETEQGILEGRFNLLPIQQQFFDWTFSDPDHFNQAFMQKIPGSVSVQTIQSALENLTLHHDSLRLCFTQTPSGWQQTYHLQTENNPLISLSIKGLSAQSVQSKLTEHQADLNIEKGPLWKVIHLTGYSDGSARLCFILHHLIIDAVSWRILSNDMQQLLTGHSLPTKTSSYRQWVKTVALYANQHSAQVDYWKGIYDKTDRCHLPLSPVSEHTIQWDKTVTQQLLRKAPEGYHTQINDLLLAALGIALSQTFDQLSHVITLEGHGREPIAAQMDTSRTVGWFTTVYPVRLVDRENTAETIIATKEQLRKIPDKGIGFSALQQAGLLEPTLADISFNYLGQLGGTDKEDMWQLVAESTGQAVSSANKNTLRLNINGAVQNNCLSFHVLSQLNETQTGLFLQAFEQAVKKVTELSVKQAKIGSIRTPSDYQTTGLSIERLRQLQSRYQDNEIEAIYPASSLQQGFVYHDLAFPDDDAYRVQLLLDYHHSLNIPLYKKAWQLASERYPVLRMALDTEGEPLQVILKNGVLTDDHFTEIDLGYLNASEREERIALLQQNDRKQGFNLNTPSLLRLMIIKHSNDHYTVMKTEHHAVSDGWSNPILWQFIHHTYQQLIAKQQVNIASETTYSEVQQYHQQHQAETDTYWKQQKTSWQGATNLRYLLDNPVDLNKHRTITVPGEIDLQLTGHTLHQLKAQCQSQGITLNAAVQFAWHKVLQVYSNSNQTIVGTTVSGRDIPVQGIENSVGLYINTLPLTVNWEKEASCACVLKLIQQQIAALNSHSSVSLSSLQSQGERLFHSLLVFENYPNPIDQDKKTQITMRGSKEKNDYPLSLIAYEHDEILTVRLCYDTTLISIKQVTRIKEQIFSILESISTAVEQPHTSINLLSNSERHTLLHTWNATDAPYLKDNTLYQVFEAQVDKTPDNIALVFENQQLTYRQLNLRANQLARQIRATYQQRHGSTLSPDTLIALYLDRSPEMIISILAVLKAGGAYVPVAPEYPQSRTLFILEDTKAPLLLTQSHYTGQLDGWINKLKGKPPVLIATDQMSDMENYVTKNLSPVSKAQDLAYVIYTSGTTGQPKGVMIEHESVINLSQFVMRTHYLSDELHVLLFSNYVFDALVYELFPTLFSGCQLFMASEHQQKDIIQLIALISEQAIKKAFIPTALMKQYSWELSNSCLEVIAIAGENLNILGNIPATLTFNQYGPTETTVYVTQSLLHDTASISLGKAIDNTRLYVLDNNNRPIPIGVPGELYIGGAGLARGYLNQPELTAERFIDNPFATDADIANGYTRLYKTGDLVRWLPDGNLEYLGRNDFQVKIRGYRIELGEIEKALTALPQVSQAVVIDREREGTKYLAAYCIAADTRESKDKNRITTLTDGLRQQLQASLPEYMVPATFTMIEHIPLTINGKLDRRALPAPEFINTDSYVAPRTETEMQLCAVWAEVLGLERVGIHDNFFRIGGDSILCIQITSRLRQKDLALQVKDIFEAPTVALLAQRLVDTTATVAVETEQGILEGRFNLLPIQQQFFDWTFSDPDHFNQAFMQKIPGSVSVQTIQSALENLTLHHDSLRLCFTQTPSGWQQTYHLQTENNPLISLSMKGLSAQSVQSKLTEHQADLNIEKGPLWKVIHLTGYSDGSARLCFILHHLIIDAVSWRILSNDMQQLLTGHSLPAKTSSYRQWVKTVALYANQHSAQVDYWKGIYDKTDRCHLPLSPVSEHTIQWDETVTQQLLRKAPEGYHTKINDLLLAALGIALSQAFDQLSHVITLEGHGREPIAAQMDTSRTVGWFTIAYPVRLVDRENTAETIIATKEQLRKIPDKGIGFSALQQAGLLEPTLADISFNYLGQLGGTDKEDMWQLVAESTGQAVSSANKTTLRLNINGAVQNNCLSFHVLSQLNETQTGLFLQAFEQAVKKVTKVSVKRAKTGGIRTPSDYQTTGLSIERLRQLQSRYQDNEIEAIYPASSLQQGFVYHDLAFPDDDAYRVQLLLDYHDSLNVPLYKKAWQLASERYPVLRMALDTEGEPLQVILKNGVLTDDHFTEIDLGYLNASEREERIALLQQNDRKQGFNLNTPGLLRLMIIKHSNDHYTVMKTEYHAVSDGWSNPILWQFIHHTYQQLIAKQQVNIAFETTYSEVQRYHQQHQAETDTYWKQQKTSWQGATNLRYLLDNPVDLNKHRTITVPGEIDLQLTGHTLHQLKAQCQSQGITLNAAVQFAWHKVLQVYSNSNQTIVGTTVSGRDIPVQGIENSVGLYINTLPLTVNWEKEASCACVLQLIQQQIAALNSHSSVSLSSLQSQGERLFHSLLVFENYPNPIDETKDKEKKTLITMRGSKEKTDYPLSLTAYEHDETLTVRLCYDTKLISIKQVTRIKEQIFSILESISTAVEQPHTSINLLSNSERHTLLHTWNATDVPYPKDNTLYQLFEDQVDKTPDNIALVFEDQQLTYRQLNLRANQLARQIRATYQQRHGSTLSPDTLIALYLDRSPEMIISILAVLKAGGAYVPVAPEYPQSRTLFILEDTKAPLLLTQSHYTGQLDRWISKLQEQPPVLIATDQMSDMANYATDNLSPVSKAKDLAYVIYTSGTTGKPKGVMTTHQGVVSLAINKSVADILPTDVFLQLASPNFDAATFEIWSALLHRAKLIIPKSTHVVSEQQITKLLKQHKISILWVTRGLFDSLYRQKPDLFGSLKYLLTGGEVLTPNIIKAIVRQSHRPKYIINGYGPTESTTFATTWISKPSFEGSVPIGRPINTRKIYVLNTNLQLAPMGVIGELYIGGAGLARGYLNQPELTAERFIDNSFATDADIANGYTRLYKTGDLVRWLPDGNLEYLGRNDFQVKIRGYRIELGEIEKALTALPQVSQAVVIDREREGTKYLAAYCIAADTRASKDKNRITALIDGLRQQLQATLPEYMVPATFTVIEHIPLTINGKLDRRALPAPEFINTDSYVAPRTETETQLCAVWAEVLGLERVGIHDNFFRIGGNSISAIRLTAKSRQMLDKDIALALLFDNPTVARLANKLSTTKVIIPVSKHQNHLPLSFAQERLLFIEQYEQGTASYHIPHMVTLDETADDTLLLRAINQLAVRHRVLNSTYHQDNETGMYYTKECQSPLSYQCGFLDSHNELKLSVQTAIAQPFNLTEEPPLRLCLYRCKHERHLLLVWHHIAFDGWSMAVFMRELAEMYKSLCELRPSQLPGLSISYGDYADWQRHYLQGEVLDKTLSHWKQQLAGYETLNLPADYPRLQHIDYQGANDNFNLTEKLSDRLRQLACDKETTLYTILLSGFYLLLNKLSNQSDLVLGTPSDNRHHPQTQALIGFFVNALPLRLQLDSNGTLNTLIEQVHATVADAKTHQELPFEKLVSELNIERDTSRHPVFQVMFSLQSFDTDSDSCTGLPFTTFTAEDKVQYSPAKFDLSLFVDDSENCIQGQWNYAVGLFTEDTIRRFNAMYLRVLTALVENTTQHLNQIDVLSRQERHTLLHTWNATDAPYPKDNTLYQLFEAQVDKTPDNIALVFEDQQLTYRQLNLRANQLARQIRATYQQRHGSTLSPDTLIALYLDRSPEMIISILAVLKAGGAYVPVAPEYPQSRTLFILEDTKAPLLLTQSHYTGQLDRWISKLKEQPPVLIATDQMSDMESYVTENLSPVSKAKDLAYVIYTSGTTGKPKGVMTTHQGVVSLAINKSVADILPTDVFLQLASPNFDAATFEIWSALLHRAKLVIPKSTHVVSEQQITKLLKQHKISILWVTRGLFDSLYRQKPNLFGSLKYLLTGGEVLTPNIIKAIVRQSHRPKYIINGYGPTESTTFATTWISEPSFEGSVPIGRPINTRKIYVLNTSLQLAPMGVIGELYIGGAGLARGYLNQPELTAERFIDNPFATEEDIANGYTRLYKTGDLVRWLPDGNLEYLGRNDFQVKIRGYRIELGEIEKALTALPQVSQAVVIDREREGTKYLAAYCIAADTCASKDNARITALTDGLRQQLQARLPEYMVPATFTMIEHIPLTINGKLDRRALPAPEFINTDSYVAPRTETETQLCAVWADVLGLKRVGIHDNFFRIGGDSILCIQITSRLRQKDLVLQVKDIFEAPTVALLAQRLVDTTATVAVETEQGILEGRFNLLPIQQQFFDWMFSDPDHFNQAFMQKIPGSVSVQTIQSALENLTLHHDSLRLYFTQTPSGWQQTYHLQTENNPLISLSIKGLSAQSVQSKLTEHQADLHIEKGPLWKVIHLTGYSDGSARLCFILHHLIIDAVSWRILSNDMQQLLTGHSLPTKTSSYRQWVKTVALYANQHSNQVDYWKGIYDKTDRCYLPLSPVSEHTIQWEKTVTQQLLRKAPEGYHTKINDLLLAALGIALSQTFDQLSHVITLEGHGREPIAAQMDTSRTVGWFTTAYPVRLVDRENTAETIIATKEQLRKIPDKGIGFSALQQAGLLEPTLADISFNYLGQLGGTDKEDMWQLVAESTGQAVSPANKNTLRLNINGAVQNNCLSFHVLSQLNETQTGLFLQAFEQAVKKVTELSVKQAKIGSIRTPSDYQTTGLSIERLRQLQSRYQNNEIEAIYPASSLQQGFVYHDLAFPDDDAYRVQLLLDYHHSLNVPLYKKAWQLASERYLVLRMALDTEGEPLQVILKNGVLTDDHFTEIDLGYLNASEREERIALLQQNDRKQGFNLNTPGLLRLMIIKHSNDHYTIMKTEHHAVSDGWSNPILWQFIHHTYQQLIAKQQVNIASETTYSEVQRYHQQHQAETDTYWKQQKTSWQGATNLRYLLDNPVDLNKHRTITVQGEIDLQLTGHALHQLKAQCQSQGITLNAAVQFAWHKVLQVYSNSNQTIVGTTVSGRDIPVQGIENSVGLYINTLPLTVNWEKEASCACVLQLIQQQIAALNSHSSVSLSSLQSQGERLFHSLLVFENYPNPVDETKDKEKKTLITIRGSKEKTDYPLSLIAYEHDETLTVRLCYDTTLISIKQVTRIKEQIFSILESISTAVEQPHTSINLLSNSERHTLLNTWNATDAPYPKDNTLYQLFEAQVDKTPDNIALVFENQQLTYRELNLRANQLARQIRATYQQRHGSTLSPDTLIALYLDRSPEMIISILAVLKAGGAYVPVAPEYPQSRTLFILEDTKAPLLLTQSHYTEQLNGWISKLKEQPPVLIATDQMSDMASYATDNLLPVSKAQDLAYVIYTSGTTGNPKGVMLSHCSVVNRIHWMQTEYPLTDKDKLLQKTPYSFDVSVWEFFWGHWVGATLVIAAPDMHKEPAQLYNLMQKYDITTVHFVPSMLNVFCDFLQDKHYKLSETVRQIFCSGEVLAKKHVEHFRNISPVDRNCQVYNLYGPTEAAIDVTFFDCSQTNQLLNIPIGKPVHNTQLYVLDNKLSLAPTGVSGELYIGGVGLARGYLNQPELTAERFIDNPFATEADIANGYTRLYKTGDLVRWLPDGNLEYLGRNDFQVKIRGYRIELGEIENALTALPQVSQAVVIDREREGTKYLAAYCIAADTRASKDSSRITTLTDELRQQLQASLPEYMVPATFTVIEDIPLTINGKLDRHALPAPEFINTDSYVAPRTETETQLCTVWADVLGLKRVGIHDNFFRIGGNSISAIRLTAKSRQMLDKDIALALLFANPTVARLAEVIGRSNQDKLITSLTPDSTNLPQLFMIHPGFAGAEVYQQIANQLKDTYSCIGINNYNLLYSKKISCLKKLGKVYLEKIMPLLRKNEPVRIAGWSLGGLISLEIASQLEKAGWHDINVYLIDTYLHAYKDKPIDKDIGKKLTRKEIENMTKYAGIDFEHVDSDYFEKIQENIPVENILMHSKVDQLNTTTVTLTVAGKDWKEGSEIYKNTDSIARSVSDIQPVITRKLYHNVATNYNHYSILKSREVFYTLKDLSST